MADALNIATARRYDAPHWKQTTITWDDFTKKAQNPIVTGDKFAVGGYVYGLLGETHTEHNGRTCRALHRNKQAMVSRDALNLDADKPGTEFLNDLSGLLEGVAYVVHTTYSSTPDAPRYRVVIPLSRSVSPGEFRRLSMHLMRQVGIENFDTTCAEPERLMFWASTPDPANYWHHVGDGDPLNVDAALVGAGADEADAPTTDPAPASTTAAQTGGPVFAEMSPELQKVAQGEVDREVNMWREKLDEAATWNDDESTDPSGRRWEALSRDFAWALAKLAAAPWSPLDEATARALYDEVLPHVMAVDDKCRGKFDRTIVRKAAAGPITVPDALTFDVVPDDASLYPDVPTQLDDAHLAPWLAWKGLDGLWRYSGGLGWMFWDGRRWNVRREEHIMEATRLAMLKANQLALTSGASLAVRRALSGLLSSGRIASVLRLLKGHVAVDGERFDQRPDLLNVGNGVVDLRTGKLLPHDPELYLTKITDVPYLPGTTHPDWVRCLTALDDDVADWMQVRIGQAATGYPTSDDVLPICQGQGSNGKSTFLAGLSSALGQHMTLVPEKLIRASPNDHPTELMTLRGTRVAVIDETPEVAQLNVPRVKAILGTTYITARAIRQDNVTWKATHSLMVMTNYTPQVAETDHGTWRRLALVRFTKTFERDDRIKARMERGVGAEAALAWIVEGARRWYANDQVVPVAPERVLKDTREWRGDMDLILRYIDECLEFDPEACVTSSDLAADFNAWIYLTGHHPWSEKTFTTRFGGHEEVTKHGVTKSNPRDPKGLVTRDGKRPGGRPKVWLGVRWREAP